MARKRLAELARGDERWVGRLAGRKASKQSRQGGWAVMGGGGVSERVGGLV